jgi:hypothetical protein
MVRNIPSPMVLAAFMSPVRSSSLPVVRILPVTEFSSGVLRVGMMHCLGVVPRRLLCETFLFPG